MAMELELDDDLFFADINKQISLLIMDDDDEHLNPVSLSSSSSISFQELFRGGYQTSPYMYNQEQSKGTGVFIPKASQPRRRHHQHHHQKQGRFSSFNAKQQHQNRQEYQQNHVNSKTTFTTQNNNNNKSSMNSNVEAFIPRRSYRDPTSIYT